MNLTNNVKQLLFKRIVKLKTRMILILGVMVLIQTGLVGGFALTYLSQALDEQMAQKAMHVANTISDIPSVQRAVTERDSNFLHPLSLKLAEKNGARYVVIADHLGIRLAHPDIDAIGLSMLDDEPDERPLTFPGGKGYAYTAQGSLGTSMRARAPIISPDTDEVIGVVSVGYLTDRIASVVNRYRQTLALVIILGFLVSAVMAIAFADYVKRAIFGLEPDQIGRLYQERNATLESVREGIIAINGDGRITTCNQTALATLGLPTSQDLIGLPVQEVLPDSNILEVLATGEPHYDQHVWMQGKQLIVNRIPLTNGGQITGVVSSFRRKDELDRVSQQLDRVQQYADSLRSQAHEYSNKLHTIAGLIQIGATEQALTFIGQENQSHQALIQLLVEAVPDPILAGCLLGKYNRARELGLSLTVDESSHMAELPDDLSREQLVAIIGNLLDNALEATLRHHGTGGEVRLSMTDLGNDLIFEMDDDGPGITPEDQLRIFEKGVTSKKGAGHGIGLYLVRKQLDELNGQIIVEPGDHGGSRFIVFIPKIPPVKKQV
ncbi:histidine kinase [Endozoicomonas elysicola]|uniref:histidine kinase n=2 Tax=Endozoicomonas elysicola TaxID=305900 RepID=A0A081K7Z4_9GAMM|nr:histidine kinase [Endozoicomonas elysicola]